jgi:hypothetical protein
MCAAASCWRADAPFVCATRPAPLPSRHAQAQTSEAAGYKKRAEESAAAGVAPTQRPPAGGDAPPPGNWSWTLNWDYVLHTEAGAVEARTHAAPLSAPLHTCNSLLTIIGRLRRAYRAARCAAQVIVGSCPKSAADVHRIADESPATAILCLQARTGRHTPLYPVVTLTAPAFAAHAFVSLSFSPSSAVS